MPYRHSASFALATCLVCMSSNGHASAALSFSFTPDPARSGDPANLSSGCKFEAGEARGTLKTGSAGTLCHDATLGSEPTGSEVFAGDNSQPTGVPSSFTSAPFSQVTELGRAGRIVVYFQVKDDSYFIGKPQPKRPLSYRIDEINGSGVATLIATGEAIEDLKQGRNEATFTSSAYTVPAGSRLRVLLGSSAPDAASGWFMYGGSRYPAGISFSTDAEESGTAGAAPLTLLLPLALIAVIRRRRPDVSSSKTL